VPSKPFVAPDAWQSKRKATPPVPAPDPALHTWHVFVDQYEPHQKNTPLWQPLPAHQTLEVHMPEGSAFRCVALPLEIRAEANDFETELEAWRLSRSVLCSSDGWRTWSSYAHRLGILPDGTRQPDYKSDAWLSERSSDGVARNTVLSLRAEPPRREATTGPPQIVSGARVSD
jgi:hypothetical protein